MFTARKLLELPYKTRLRKLVLILQQVELDISRGSLPDPHWVYSLLDTLQEKAPGRLKELITKRSPAGEPLLRQLNAIRHTILQQLNQPPAEWDFIHPQSSRLDSSIRQVLPCRVYLEELRSPFNVGSLFRTAECFGVEQLYLSPGTPLPTHPRSARTARGAAEVLPWALIPLAELPAQPAIFALETGGTPLARFDFPRAGLVLIGSEELGLSPEALRLADSSAGRVAIPLLGAKRSLNVSVAFGILMHYWSSRLAVPLQR